MKPTNQLTLAFALCLAIALPFLSCKKEHDNSNTPPNVTPELLESWIGKDYRQIEGQLKNLPDYAYSLPSQWYGNIHDTTVVAQVKILKAPVKDFRLQLYLTGANKIKSAQLYGFGLNQEMGDSAVLYFYEHAALKLAPPLTFQQQRIDESSPSAPMPIIDDLIYSLKYGNARFPSIDWENSSRRVSIVYFPAQSSYVVFAVYGLQ